MVKHNNPTISEDACRIFNTKTGDMLGSEVNPTILPVMLITRKANINRSISTAVSGTTTIYTTPSDKDFYLTNVQISLVKDVTCDIGSGRISVTALIDGVTQHLISIAALTLTAERDSLAQSFNIPIKLDRGTVVQVSGTFTAGAMVRTVLLHGYTVEVTKGV